MIIPAIILTAAAVAPVNIPLPRYKVSDAFVYSDGRVERVRAVKGATIIWSGLNNTQYTRSRNPAVPVLNWRFGKGTGRRDIVGKANSLWPLGQPKSVRFRAIAYTKLKPQSATRRAMTLWTCSSKKVKIVNIPLGSFDTIPIICDRFSATTMRLIERIEWDYSPELRHYVRRASVDYSKGTRSTIVLTAALSGPAAHRRRLAALSAAARASNRN